MSQGMRVAQFVGLTVLALVTADRMEAAPAIGDPLPAVTLAGDDGGLVKDGGAWSSSMIKGKVWGLFYVDPDFRDANEELTETLKAQNFSLDQWSTIAVTNMDASRLPNFIISSALKSKQEKYPDTIYVRDFTKFLVNKWGLKDDAYQVLVFDKQGKVLFVKDGDFTKDDIKAMIDVIKAHLNDPA